MKSVLRKKSVILAGLFLLASIIALWSWNTLAGLFGIPHAQYKHVVAALALLLTTKWVLWPHRVHQH